MCGADQCQFHMISRGMHAGENAVTSMYSTAMTPSVVEKRHTVWGHSFTIDHTLGSVLHCVCSQVGLLSCATNVN